MPNVEWHLKILDLIMQYFGERPEKVITLSEYNPWFAPMNCYDSYTVILYSATCVLFTFNLHKILRYYDIHFIYEDKVKRSFPRLCKIISRDGFQTWKIWVLLPFLATLLITTQYCLTIKLSYSMFKERKPFWGDFSINKKRNHIIQLINHVKQLTY